MNWWNEFINAKKWTKNEPINKQTISAIYTQKCFIVSISSWNIYIHKKQQKKRAWLYDANNRKIWREEKKNKVIERQKLNNLTTAQKVRESMGRRKKKKTISYSNNSNGNTMTRCLFTRCSLAKIHQNSIYKFRMREWVQKAHIAHEFVYRNKNDERRLLLINIAWVTECVRRVCVWTFLLFRSLECVRICVRKHYKCKSSVWNVITMKFLATEPVTRDNCFLRLFFFFFFFLAFESFQTCGRPKF